MVVGHDALVKSLKHPKIQMNVERNNTRRAKDRKQIPKKNNAKDKK